MRVLGHTTAIWLFLAATSVVCLAQTPSFTSGESVARVTTLAGQVSVLRDSNPWALHVNDSVRMQQVIVTGADGYATFQVSDGSTFEVFPNSRVVFRNNPGNWKDLLDLYIGRVKVHVQKLLGGQPNPTTVHSPTAVISVRGTIFDVVAEDEDLTVVSVEEGQVAVRHAIFSYNGMKLLNPGDTIKVYRNQPLAVNTIDKSNIIQRALHAAAEAVYQAVYQIPQSGGVPAGGSGGGTGSNGDTGTGKKGGGQAPPSAPPPPPPTAPPPPH